MTFYAQTTREKVFPISVILSLMVVAVVAFFVFALEGGMS